MDHRIKDLIKEKGYTQQEFADKLEMTRVGLSQLINGKPSYPTLEKIATALDVPMWQLFATPEEVAGEDELIALIQHKGNFYKATTISELQNITKSLSKNDLDDLAQIFLTAFVNNYYSEDSQNKKVNFTLKELTNSINSLNEELKQPFVMYLSGYKFDEIAEKLNIPLGTVKSRIFIARQEIQKLLLKQV